MSKAAITTETDTPQLFAMTPEFRTQLGEKAEILARGGRVNALCGLFDAFMHVHTALVASQMHPARK